MLSLPAMAVDAVEQLQAFTKQVRSAQGDFMQQQIANTPGVDGKPRVTKQLDGNFRFVRPGKFVWNTEKPYEQKMIADGKQLILWDKDLNQATIRPATKALAATPAAILFGDSSIEHYFDLKSVGDKGNLSWVELIPKTAKGTEEEIPYEKIGIGMQDGLPKAMELRDHFGNVVLLTFSNMQRNIPISTNAFIFKAPVGAEVVRTP